MLHVQRLLLRVRASPGGTPSPMSLCGKPAGLCSEALGRSWAFPLTAHSPPLSLSLVLCQSSTVRSPVNAKL